MAAMTNRYSDEELREFKELIDDKLVKARDEVRFLREQMLEITENSANQQSGDWTDESSSHMEIEMLNNSLTRQQQFIRNLELALIRIQNKTYGVCTMTGQLIDKQRLRLVPHATKSVEAKNARPVANTSTHAVADPSVIRRKTDDEQVAIEVEETVSMQKEFYANE
jgi:RNA polymerase-binding transcription factor DksA